MKERGNEVQTGPCRPTRTPEPCHTVLVVAAVSAPVSIALHMRFCSGSRETREHGHIAALVRFSMPSCPVPGGESSRPSASLSRHRHADQPSSVPDDVAGSRATEVLAPLRIKTRRRGRRRLAKNDTPRCLRVPKRHPFPRIIHREAPTSSPDPNPCPPACAQRYRGRDRTNRRSESVHIRTSSANIHRPWHWDTSFEERELSQFLVQPPQSPDDRRRRCWPYAR